MTVAIVTATAGQVRDVAVPADTLFLMAYGTGLCGHPAASALAHWPRSIFPGQTALAEAAPAYSAKHVPDHDSGTRSRPCIIDQRLP